MFKRLNVGEGGKFVAQHIISTEKNSKEISAHQINKRIGTCYAERCFHRCWV